MQVYFYNSQKRFPICSSSVKAVVQSVLKVEKQKADEVAVHFVGVKKICSLHAEFFDDKSPTDCISFPIDEAKVPGYRVLGEVFVCPETGFKYLSPKERLSEERLYEEFTLYLVHGLLHLLGYDDIASADEQIMRQKEQIHMQQLKKAKMLLHK